MKHAYRIIGALGLSLGLVCSAAVAGSKESAGMTKESVEKMIADADAAREKAASVGGEWRDTADMITKAQAELASGNLEGAAKLAGKAMKEGEWGYEQMMAQQELKMPSYLKY